MTPDARRKALSAASRVAWLSALGLPAAACGGVATSTDGTDRSTSTDPSEVAGEPFLDLAATDEKPGSTGGPSVDGPSTGGATAASSGGATHLGVGGASTEVCTGGTDAACCVESLAALQVENSWATWQDPDAAREDPLVQACCEVALQTGEQLISDSRAGCCEVVDGADFLQCTPWGPPPPPAFSGGWV
jgi:hypothetical protein